MSSVFAEIFAHLIRKERAPNIESCQSQLNPYKARSAKMKGRRYGGSLGKVRFLLSLRTIFTLMLSPNDLGKNDITKGSEN